MGERGPTGKFAAFAHHTPSVDSIRLIRHEPHQRDQCVKFRSEILSCTNASGIAAT